MDTPDFIEIFPDALSREACAALVSRFEACGQASPGIAGTAVQPEVKRSDDICVSILPQWRDAEEQLYRAVIPGLRAYARKYPHLLLASIEYDWTEPGGVTRSMRAEDFAALSDQALTEVLAESLRPGKINLQRYRAGIGGYPRWHCEQSPLAPQTEALHRAVLWTIYLNDGFEEGETEFLYQQRKIVPQTGALLIAPTAFTHTHRGNRPLGGDKYIATSWILFKRADQMVKR
ncbi:2OG-Fe(II) oxygenase [Arenimonas sp.]|uniref:2OG-Fe(II) oxygenase n=1 Tax=Arenimonas sp. TaxID=1872635 RepID=UPI0039E36CDB